METRTPYDPSPSITRLEPILSRRELDDRAARPAAPTALESLRLMSQALNIPFDAGSGSQLDVELGLLNCNRLIALNVARRHGRPV